MRRHQGGTGVPADGFPYRQVRVQSIDSTSAQTVDRWGAHITVSTLYRRGGGPFPKLDEVWIIDRAHGFWTFASLVTGLPPIITGSTVGIPGLTELLVALDAAGIIVNRSNDLSQNTYNTGWISLGSVSCQKIASGLVLLRGVSSGAFTLPVGYRPSVTMTLAGMSSNAITVTSTDSDSVLPSGVHGVFPVTVSPSGAASSAPAVIVDGLSFLAEP